MARKKLPVVLMVIGALLSISGGVFVYTQLQQAEEVARRIPVVAVVVALADLPDRAAVPPEGVALAKVPSGGVPANAATRIEDVVGKYPLVPIYRSEAVLLSRLAETGRKLAPSFSLKNGLLAVSLPGSDLLTGTGAVQPGDRVDVVLTVSVPTAGTDQRSTGIPWVTQKLLQNVEVLRVGGFAAGGPLEAGTGGKNVVTVQVDHQDALILMWAKDSGGTVNLALRHPSHEEIVPTEAITADYIFRRFRFGPSEPQR